MASFGIGAMLLTLLALAGAYGRSYWQKQEDLCEKQGPPKMHLRALLMPGTAAGLLWCSGNFFQTAAVVRGGNATWRASLIKCLYIYI